VSDQESFMLGRRAGRCLAAIMGGIAIVMLAGGLRATAQDVHGIEIAGDAIATGTITAEELSRLPVVEQKVRYRTSKGEDGGRYKGPLLWSILEARGLADLPGHNTQLRHSFVVEGRDGYRIVFSIGEIDPDFGNAPIQLATERDGKPMAPGEGYRLVVPGDKRGARHVRDVVKIEVQ